MALDPSKTLTSEGKKSYNKDLDLKKSAVNSDSVESLGVQKLDSQMKLAKSSQVINKQLSRKEKQ